MAIARDAATDGGNNGVAGPTHSFNHTCTGSDLYLQVTVVGDLGGGADDISSVTYNGVGMTLVRKEAGATVVRMTYVYALMGPATGTHAVLITAGSTHFLQGAARSYTGVSQTGQPEVSSVTFSNADADSSLTVAITPLTANSWVLLTSGGYDANSLPAAGTGANLWLRDTTFGLWGFFDSNGAQPASSYSTTWTYPNPGSNPDMVSVLTTIAPVSAGRTAKNTRSNPLGVNVGMGWRMPV